MTFRNRANRFLYWIIISILVVGNVIVLMEYIVGKDASGLQRPDRLPLPRTGQRVAQHVELESTNGILGIQSTDERGVVLLSAGSDPTSLGHVGILRLLSETRLADSILMAILFTGPKGDLGRVQGIAGTVPIVPEGEQAMMLLGNQLLPPNHVLVLHGDTILYEGSLLKQHLYQQLVRIATEASQSIAEFEAIPEGTLLYGSLRSVKTDNVLRIEDLGHARALVLYSTYCNTCGDGATEDLLSSIVPSPIISVLPSIYDNRTVEEYERVIGRGKEFHILSIEASNITAREFLVGHPVVLVVANGKCAFISKLGMSSDDVVKGVTEALRDDIAGPDEVVGKREDYSVTGVPSLSGATRDGVGQSSAVVHDSPQQGRLP